MARTFGLQWVAAQQACHRVGGGQHEVLDELSASERRGSAAQRRLPNGGRTKARTYRAAHGPAGREFKAPRAFRCERLPEVRELLAPHGSRYQQGFGRVAFQVQIGAMATAARYAGGIRGKALKAIGAGGKALQGQRAAGIGSRFARHDTERLVVLLQAEGHRQGALPANLQVVV